MKNLYIVLAVIGFLAPNILVGMESVETGNVLLWLDPQATIEGMFANRISAIFAVDLLVVVMVFFVWSYFEARKYSIRRLGLIWVLTLMFGLAGTLPCFSTCGKRQFRRKIRSAHAFSIPHFTKTSHSKG